MVETMDDTLMNPNELCSYGMSVQDNTFAEAPIFIALGDHDFMLLIYSKGNILGVTTITPADKELQTCPYVKCLLLHE